LSDKKSEAVLDLLPIQRGNGATETGKERVRERQVQEDGKGFTAREQTVHPFPL